LPAALNGDAEAQYYIFAALRECAPSNALFGEGKQLSDVLVNPGFSEAGRRYMTRLWTLCEGLRTADPFAGLPQSPDPRSPATWLQRAAAQKHVLSETVRVWGDLGRPAEERRASVLELATKFETSPDPRAMLYLGALVGQFGAASGPSGMALMLVACELGAACSEGQADGVMPACGEVDDPTCIPGATVAEQLQRAVGPAEFARVYAIASDIRQRLVAGDPRVIEQTVEAALAGGG
jgi:hypothetical protein